MFGLFFLFFFCFFFCFCFIFILVALYLCFFFSLVVAVFILHYFITLAFFLLAATFCVWFLSLHSIFVTLLNILLYLLVWFFMPTSFSSYAASVPSLLIHSTVLRVSCLHSSPLFLPLAVLEASLSHSLLLWLLFMLYPRESLSRPLTQSGRILSYPSDHDGCCEPRLCTQC